MAVRKKTAQKKTTKRTTQKKGVRSGSRSRKKKTTKGKQQLPDVVERARNVVQKEYDPEDGTDFCVVNGLTSRQAAFVQEYMIDGNGLQAATRAGYSAKTAGAAASRLLKHEKVSAALKRAQAARAERTSITADRVLLELGRIGLVDVTELFVWDENEQVFVPSKHLTPDQRAAIQGVESTTIKRRLPGGILETKTRLRLKTYDKVAALKEIGKHLGIGENVNLYMRNELTALSDDQFREEGERILKALRKRDKVRK